MKYIIGGIGDFLQVVDSSLLEEEPALVYSHQSCAKDFFEGVGVKAEVNLFSKLEELKDDFRISISEPLRRDFYQSFALPRRGRELALRLKEEHPKRFLGIHPVGSDFSDQFHASHGRQPKKMPFDFFREIVSFLSKDFHLLVFGTSKELSKEYKLPLLKSDICDAITWISCENIWDTLAHVLICDKIIAVDSAIKSMASVKNIPSVVFVGDYEDGTRDSLFLDQYVGDGVMKVIKYTELKEKELKELKLCLE